MRDDRALLVVTGLPGAGKSTIGRIIATRSGLHFVDKDDILASSLANATRRTATPPETALPLPISCDASLRWDRSASGVSFAPTRLGPAMSRR